MSPTARRYFGCILPLLLCVFGCGTMLLLGYSAQVIFQLVRVPDDSMAPALAAGRQALVNNTDFWNADPSRGQVVSVRRPGGWAIRRVIALPGETVEVRNGRALVGGLACDGVPPSAGTGPDQPALRLAPGEYFVLADNRAFPDSRNWGPVQRSDLVGVVAFQIDRDRNFDPVPVATACPGPTATPRPTSEHPRRSPRRSWFAPDSTRPLPSAVVTVPATAAP
jgi:signal peptidase I